MTTQNSIQSEGEEQVLTFAKAFKLAYAETKSEEEPKGPLAPLTSDMLTDELRGLVGLDGFSKETQNAILHLSECLIRDAERASNQEEAKGAYRTGGEDIRWGETAFFSRTKPLDYPKLWECVKSTPITEIHRHAWDEASTIGTAGVMASAIFPSIAPYVSTLVLSHYVGENVDHWGGTLRECMK